MKKFFIVLLSSLLVLAACGKNYEISDITNKFKKEGLSVENLRKMEREDFGMAPMKTENAKIFTVSEDKNARILKFKNEDDLKEMKSIMKNWVNPVLRSIHMYTLKINFNSNEWRH